MKRWRRGIQRTSSIKMLPRNDADDLGGLKLTHFAMPIINIQIVLRWIVKNSNSFLIDFYHQERWTPIWTQNLKTEVKLLVKRWIYWWPEVESNDRYKIFKSFTDWSITKSLYSHTYGSNWAICDIFTVFYLLGLEWIVNITSSWQFFLIT